MSHDLSVEEQVLIEQIVAEKPWVNAWFYLYSFVRAWVATIFSVSISLAVGLSWQVIVGLALFSLLGDFLIQRVVLDRKISDRDLAASIFKRKSFDRALDAKDQAKLLGKAFLFLLVVSGALPLVLPQLAASGIFSVYPNFVDEFFLTTLIFTEIVVLLGASRCVEVIPPTKDESYESLAAAWTVSVSSGRYQPGPHDGLTTKSGTYFGWNGSLLALCIAFLFTTNADTTGVVPADFAIGEIYGTVAAFHFFSLLACFALFHTSLVPWRMRGYAMILFARDAVRG